MGRPELQWSDVGSEDPRRVTGGARGRSAAGRLRLLELVIRPAKVLWKCSRGQLGTRVDGGERIGRAAQLTVDRLGRDSGELGPGLRGRELGKLPGCSAVLLRGSSGVERQRGGVSAAEQSPCSAEQREAAARVCGEAAGWGIGVPGGWLGCLRRHEPGDLGVRAQGVISARSAAVSIERAGDAGGGGRRP